MDVSGATLVDSVPVTGSIVFQEIAADVAAGIRRSSGAEAKASAGCRYHSCWQQWFYPLQTARQEIVEATALQEVLAVGTVILALLLGYLLIYLRTPSRPSR